MQNRDFLRTRTQAAHDRAERRWTDPNGFGGLQEYREWLSTMLALHQRFGRPAAARLENDVYVATEEDRIVALLADLGGSPSSAPSDFRNSVSWSWGAEYVLNGSAIGASLLLKRAITNPDWPRAYLTEMSRFASAGSLKSFFGSLDAATIDRHDALCGAIAVFDESFTRA